MLIFMSLISCDLFSFGEVMSCMKKACFFLLMVLHASVIGAKKTGKSLVGKWRGNEGILCFFSLDLSCTVFVVRV